VSVTRYFIGQRTALLDDRHLVNVAQQGGMCAAMVSAKALSAPPGVAEPLVRSGEVSSSS